MDELEYTFEVLREENALSRADNTTLRDKDTKLETKSAGVRNNLSNLSRAPSSDITNLHQ